MGRYLRRLGHRRYGAVQRDPYHDEYIAADSTYAPDTSLAASMGAATLARVSARRTVSRVTFGVSAGFLSTPTVHRVGWAGASAAIRLLPLVSFVATAGTRASAMTWLGDPSQARALPHRRTQRGLVYICSIAAGRRRSRSVGAGMGHHALGQHIRARNPCARRAPGAGAR